MRIKIKNVLLLIVLIILIVFAIIDVVTISTSLAQYTWFGIATTLLTLYLISKILEYFDEVLSK
jgi:uncharacterized membrane protein